MTTMTMIISKIRFDKTVSSCPGKNSPCKREDNTRPRSSRRDFFSLLVQRKLLFFSFLFWRHVRRVGKGTRCSSLCRRIHRLRVGSQTMETVGIFVASRKNNGTRVSPSPSLRNSQPLPREKQRSSSAYRRLLHLFRAFRRAFLCRNVAGRDRERERGEEHPFPSSLCRSIERFRK